MRPIKDRKTTLRLDSALDDRVDVFARNHDMPKAMVIRHALLEFLERHE